MDHCLLLRTAEWNILKNKVVLQILCFFMISNKIVKCILINLFVMENSNNVQTISLSNAKSNKY